MAESGSVGEGERGRPADGDDYTWYDLRTGPERLHAQADDHQRRIAALEQRISRLERQMQPAMSHLFEYTAPDLP